MEKLLDRAKPWLPGIGWLALVVYMLLQSWVSEDAYITFRVIDNFLHGYGLRWNVTERVQAYTHPLWLLLQIPFAALWNNLFFMNIALSLTCSAAAVAIVLRTFRRPPVVTLVFYLLPLALSKAFIDYSTSGLETSLSFLLFAMLGFVVVHWQPRKYFPLAVSLLASLLLLNRLDHIILVAPLLLLLYYQHEKQLRSVRGIGQLALGALPMVAWFSFSLFYYGFLFPNTKYAKLDTGLPLMDYLEQGLQYSFIWLTQDTASVATAIIAVVAAWRSKNITHRALALGILLNFLYVIYIGGDYMMGRFFAFIFFASAWLLLACTHRPKMDLLFAAVTVLLLASCVSYFVRNIRVECEACVPIKGRVLDARRVFWNNSLFISTWPLKTRSEGQYKFNGEGRKMAEEFPPPLRPLMYVGMNAYYAGPRAVFIDELGLADALLARLPARSDRPFYVGHFRRYIPRGYVEVVRGGSLRRMQPDIAYYYNKLRLITQGELWEKERLLTILRFNFGQYEPSRYAFLHPPPPRPRPR